MLDQALVIVFRMGSICVGGQAGMGFQNLSSSMLVRQLMVPVPYSGLEGLSPSLPRVSHYIHEIIIISISLLSKECLIPLVKWKVVGSSIWSVILFSSGNLR